MKLKAYYVLRRNKLSLLTTYVAKYGGTMTVVYVDYVRNRMRQYNILYQDVKCYAGHSTYIGISSHQIHTLEHPT